MKIRSVLFVLFTLATVGPALSAVIMYQGNLPSLIISPSTLETIQEFREATLHITYVGYEVIDPESFLRILFDISNPYNTSISITSIVMHCYCHEHGTYIGAAVGETLPLNIPAKNSETLSIVLWFTEDGKNDVLGHHDSSNDLYLDLREMVVVINGVEVRYDGDVAEIGPIPLS